MTTFRAISIAILAWNVVGCLALVIQSSIDLDALAETDPITANALAQMPAWVWAAYSGAVLAGTLGSLSLLMRRRAAWQLFLISLLAELIQFGWTFLSFGLVAQKGAGTLIFPGVIVFITLASLIYARRKAADGTLNR